MVGIVELDSTFPIIQTVCRRSPQTPGTDLSICLRRGADPAIDDGVADRSQTVADHMENRLNTLNISPVILSSRELIVFQWCVV